MGDFWDSLGNLATATDRVKAKKVILKIIKATLDALGIPSGYTALSDIDNSAESALDASFADYVACVEPQQGGG